MQDGKCWFICEKGNIELYQSLVLLHMKHFKLVENNLGQTTALGIEVTPLLEQI